jgi:hypothetical protein
VKCRDGLVVNWKVAVRVTTKTIEPKVQFKHLGISVRAFFN